MRYDSLNMPSIAGLLKYRAMTIPPTSPRSLPLQVDVVYCSNCGRVIAMLRAESPS